MTHRERILCTLSHEEPDKMAIDFGGMRSTGITAVAYNNLRKYLGLSIKNTRVYDLFQQLAEPELDILERFGGDVLQLHRYCPSFGIPIDRWRPDELSDGSPCLVPQDFHPVRREDGALEVVDGDKVIARMPGGGYWYDQVYHPLAEAKSPEDIDAHDFGLISDAEQDYLERESKRLFEKTDFAILGEFGGNLLEGGHADFGYQRFMELLVIEPDLVEYYLDKMVENYLKNLQTYLDLVGDRIQIVQFGDDLGTQEALQISPRMYKQFFKPRHEKLFRFVKENSNASVFFHSCGEIYELIPDLIEIGVDILNPVQISAPKMQPEKLKKEFGDKLTFWGGGCDTQTVLPRASIDEIRKHVGENIRVFSKGGGFVFNQVHNIQQDIAPERIVAMYETAVAMRAQKL